MLTVSGDEQLLYARYCFIATGTFVFVVLALFYQANERTLKDVLRKIRCTITTKTSRSLRP